MKEITRRLYTKPVMLSMAFLVGMALVLALFVTTNSTAAPNSFPVAAGNDEFETPGDGESFHDFEGSPIPANFFGQGSLAYAELVPLVGVPLSAGSNVDTVIQRHQSVAAPGGTTTLTMTGLSLKSIKPITVTYSNGTTESWDVKVGLSVFKSSTGSMKINASTFDSTLKVWPRFTFTRNGVVKVFDTGGSTSTALTASDSAFASDDIAIEPAPGPAPAPTAAPCRITAIDSTKVSSETDTATAAASSSCSPITLSSTNSPWGPCGTGGFCIPVPITEEERWARHRPGPRGTIQGGAVAE